MPVSPLLPEDPSKIGQYQLTGRLGQGGQGIVYLGVSAEGRSVAVKTLIPETADDPHLMDRFAREVQAAQRVPSHCTARVLDFDLTGAPRYIVSEYVKGLTLQDTVSSDGPRSGDDLHRLAIATATALTTIHGAEVIHRDFKPANVIVGDSGARVVDFGIAREIAAESSLTGAGTVGTPLYMAPEQIEGAMATRAVDVFAWGAVMTFAATGRPPFQAPTVTALFKRILHDQPDLGTLEEPLRGIVSDCLAKDPAARPEIGTVLMRLLGGRSAPATMNVTKALDEGTRIAEGAQLPAGTWPYGGVAYTEPPRTFPLPAYPYPTYPPFPPPRRRSKLPLLLGCGLPVIAVVVFVALIVNMLYQAGQEEARKKQAALQPRVSVPADLAGNWMGLLTPQESGGREVFRISLVAGRHDGTERYVLNRCTGTLVPQKISNGQLVLNEVVGDPCTNSQLGLRKRGDGRLNLVMYADASGTKVSHTAELSRLPKGGAPRLPDAMTGTWVGKDSDDFSYSLILTSADPDFAGKVTGNEDQGCSLAPVSATGKHAVLQSGGSSGSCRPSAYELDLTGSRTMRMRLTTDDGHNADTAVLHRVD